MATRWLAGCILAFLTVHLMDAYPQGAPVVEHPNVCADMEPVHDTTRQTGPSPFEIITNSDCFSPGMVVEVTIRLANYDQPYFEGLLVEARPSENDDNMTAAGQFSSTDPQLKAVNCFGATGNAITQTLEEHFDYKTFNWTAPASGWDKNTVFRGTIIRKKSIYWVGVESKVLTYQASGCMTRATPPLKITTTQPATASDTTTMKKPDASGAGGATACLVISLVSFMYAFLI